MSAYAVTTIIIFNSRIQITDCIMFLDDIMAKTRAELIEMKIQSSISMTQLKDILVRRIREA